MYAELHADPADRLVNLVHRLHCIRLAKVFMVAGNQDYGGPPLATPGETLGIQGIRHIANVAGQHENRGNGSYERFEGRPCWKGIDVQVATVLYLHLPRGEMDFFAG